MTCELRRYLFNKYNWILVIGHPCDHAPTLINQALKEPITIDNFVIDTTATAIVSTIKFSTVIGSPPAYLLRNPRAIMHVRSNCRSFVIGYGFARSITP